MLSLALVTLLAACGGGTPPAPEAPPVPEAPAAVEATPAAAAPAATVDAACLDKADQADGAADKVIHKCANCGLGMDGSDAQASTYEGYAVHSCSEGCKTAFDADPAGVLAKACAH